MDIDKAYQLPGLVNIAQLEEVTGLNHSTIYRKMEKAEFPLPVYPAIMAGHKALWDRLEIIHWMEQGPPPILVSDPSKKVLRLSDVCELLQCSEAVIRRLIKEEGFPKLIRFNGRKRYFVECEVLAWIEGLKDRRGDTYQAKAWRDAQKKTPADESTAEGGLP